MPEQWKESIIVPIYKKGDKTDCTNYQGYRCYQLHATFYSISFSQGKVHIQTKLLWIISVGFNVTDQLLADSNGF
jgi:hypothetical protein